MRRRTRTSLLIAGIAVVLLAALIFLRQKAPPEAARLLPESDGIVYFSLKPLRTATHFEQHPVPHDPAYQRFIDATGFVFERDLNEAAFALHRMPDPAGPNGPVAFSEVFEGRFDGKRVARYLETESAGSESYAGHTVYSIPSEGRTLRVALLGYDMVAASNAPTPEQIHAILDRHRTAALPFAGSSVLSEYYGQVPALALAWGVGKLSLPLSQGGGPQLFGLRLLVDPDTAFVASVRWFGSLHLRIEEIAPTPAAAQNAATTAQTMIGLMREALQSFSADVGSEGYRSLLNSAEVQSKGNRATLTATLPVNLLDQLFASPAPAVPPAVTPPQPTLPPAPPVPPAPKAGHRGRHPHAAGK